MKKLILTCLTLLLVVGYAVEGKETVIDYSEIDKAAYKIILCESGGKHDGLWGDKDKPYPAYGICQFQSRTFNYMKKLAGRPELKWKNKDDQIWLLKWALVNKLGGHWTCFKKGGIDGWDNKH